MSCIENEYNIYFFYTGSLFHQFHVTIAKPMQNIEKNLAQVRLRMSQAAQQFNRQIKDVTLLAVSKTKPVSDIKIAYACGQRHFGENYLQEAEQKIVELKDKKIIWHYIGPIQSNKTHKISELFDWAHSVDRLKIARRLSEQRPDHKSALNILLQVNIDSETSKSGILVNEIQALSDEVANLPGIKLRGLMAIPAIHQDFNLQRKSLAKMHQALVQLQKNHPDCDTLSMGMSGDMKAAIAEGSTLVRIGTAIFGTRLK